MKGRWDEGRKERNKGIWDEGREYGQIGGREGGDEGNMG